MVRRVSFERHDRSKNKEPVSPMMKRLGIVGICLAIAGLGLAWAGFFYGLPQADDGLDAAQAMYQAQGVTLTYNDEGQLVDRGTPEGAQAILALLEGDWNYPVDHDNLDPDDPIVNTRDELMYEYATITYHVLHGTVAVKLVEADVPITYRGVTYNEPGTYDIAVEKYYAQLDRTNPIERQLREAWSPLALGLLGSLAAGHANQAAGEIAQAMSLAIGGIGLVFVAAGGGLVWASLSRGQPALVTPPAVPTIRRGTTRETASPVFPRDADEEGPGHPGRTML